MPTGLSDIIAHYERVVRGVDAEARANGKRAYGGRIRAEKGRLVVAIAERLVKIAWGALQQPTDRLSFSPRSVRIPLKREYLERIKNRDVKDYIRNHIANYYYEIQPDVPVSVDGRLVMAIECKAYTENAMLKRIVVDFTLLQQLHPDLKCVLLQLESQLTGDYGQLGGGIVYGSPSTHTLLSYFDVDLNIVTLLQGERRVDRPIHVPQYFKPLTEEALGVAVETVKGLLCGFARHR